MGRQTQSEPPSLRLRGAITNKIASTPSLPARLRARRYGLNRVLGKSPPLELYYEAGDPHSHLCAQILPLLQERLRTEIHIYVVGEPQPLLYPEADKQRAFALQDAVRIAPAWGLEFSANAVLPDSKSCQNVAAHLLKYSGGSDVQAFLHRERALNEGLWSAGNESTAAPALDTSRLQRANQRRRKLGHYLPGMWQFDGEWFWGLDRLGHLEQRLRARGLLQGDAPIARLDPSKARLPASVPEAQMLEFFFSFRSPYSYLAAMQMRTLQPRLGLPLNIRPVLPMAMRGLKVPAAKRFYIVRDVYREARHLGIDFGRIADPIGAGAQRCLSLYPLAEGEDQQLNFITEAATAVWSQAVDVASDRGMRYVCASAGLDWRSAEKALASQAPLDYAEANRKRLFAAGFWGVPTFRLGGFTTWGRDRLWMLEEALRRSGQLAPR